MLGKVEICGVNTACLPTLTQEETDALLRRVRAGDREARSRLIEGNLRLVLSVIQRFAARRSQKGESCDDLFQVGCIGLIKAIDNFDVEQNVRFSTYGVPMIIGWSKPERRLYSMTRKQALALAIRLIREDGAQPEAAEILHTLSEELSLTRWTDKAIQDAVEQFILDHGRTPTVTDFKKRRFPPHTVIQNKYRVILRTWLTRNCPSSPSSQDEANAEVTEHFIRDYQRVQPASGEEYNRKRSPGTPCWYTIARYNHVHCWRELLSKQGLPVYSKRPAPEVKPKLTANIISDYY